MSDAEIDCYDIYTMSEEEVKAILWRPQVLATAYGIPYRFGLPVLVDEETANHLYRRRYNWLWLGFMVKGQRNLKPKAKNAPDWSRAAASKVHLMSIDDSSYGAWLPDAPYAEFPLTFYKLLEFIRELDCKKEGLNGELLIHFCKHELGAIQFDYD